MIIDKVLEGRRTLIVCTVYNYRLLEFGVYAGPVGFLGNPGSTGATGATGFPGSVGVAGFQGSRGPFGFTGQPGSMGVRGKCVYWSIFILWINEDVGLRQEAK